MPTVLQVKKALNDGYPVLYYTADGSDFFMLEPWPPYTGGHNSTGELILNTWKLTAQTALRCVIVNRKKVR